MFFNKYLEKIVRGCGCNCHFLFNILLKINIKFLNKYLEKEVRSKVFVFIFILILELNFDHFLIIEHS